MQFCKAFKFARMGAFAYSEEDGTPAASLPEQVSYAINIMQALHCKGESVEWDRRSHHGVKFSIASQTDLS